MTDTTANAPAHIRHQMAIEELEAEGECWFTGAAIPDAQSADDVANFLTTVDAALKAAKADKEAEFRPHKQAADAVTEAYKPALTIAERLLKTGKQLVSDFERKRQAEERERARLAAEEAARIKAEAEAALQASRGDLEARRQAEEMAADAKAAEIAARAIAKDDGRVKIGGRRVAMREHVDVTVTDETALLKWAWAHHRDELVGFAADLAERAAKSGRASIDGVEITRERRAA